MPQNRPEQLFGHFSRALPIGVGQTVTTGRGGTPNGGERPAMELKRVAQIVQTDTMNQLRIQQMDDMVPRPDSARLVIHSSLPGNPGNFVLRNEMANLAQDVELGTRWLNSFVFHPCRVAGSKHQANAFFISYGMTVKKGFNSV